ncbi:MAG: DUF1302 domain-containing protein [Pseudomonadota bacterium]|nr:DUF1302 domain-containing protein [Pseudomonadota bacterium]
MMQQTWSRSIARVAALVALCALARVVAAEEALPALGEAVAGGETWKTDVYYENDTHVRGADYTGRSVGLSKFRNTLQLETDRKLSGGWAFHGILRGTFDGAYVLNDTHFGNKAGGPVELQNSAGPAAAAAGVPLPPAYAQGMVPQGGGIGHTFVAGAFGLSNNAFVDSYANNPNSGMIVLGQNWHATAQGGVEFGVPVRPCDTDSRGCRDFGGYGNEDLQQLEAPEFNNRLDVLREAYVKKTIDLDDTRSLFLKVGKQQVVWGRTDLFRVLDVINPVDYSRNNIYDELQDIRIPMWIAQGEYRMGGSEGLQERNLQVVWNFDKFRPNNLGQCGQPNVILDASCFFRGMANLWDNGGTVANFANFSQSGAGPWFATNFGAHQIGIRNVNLPDWKLDNTQLGLKFEGVTQGGTSFSLNALSYRSQLPSLHSINGAATNPFLGVPGNLPGGPAVARLIAFDVYYPRVNLLGGSLDLQWESAKAAVRLEGAFTQGEEFANSLRDQLFSRNPVFRSVIGIDRPTFIPWINPNRTTLISGQLFFQHIFQHESQQGLYGTVGMPDWENNEIGTLLIKAFLNNDRLSPQLIIAHDFQADATALSPQVDWIFSDDLKFSFGANVKVQGGISNWKADDCRSCNPYPPFTTYPGQTVGSAGLSGLEPLGIFRAGPIGAAWRENEVYVSLRYKF